MDRKQIILMCGKPRRTGRVTPSVTPGVTRGVILGYPQITPELPNTWADFTFSDNSTPGVILGVNTWDNPKHKVTQ